MRTMDSGPVDESCALPPMSDDRMLREAVEAVYRAESRRVFATQVRLLGDFDLAEEALHDAFRAALEQWPRDGVSANPQTWLVPAGRFKAIDTLRRHARFEPLSGDIDEWADPKAIDPATRDDEYIEDDRLRLIFTCCHPALSADAQVALTLREVCGLTTEEIARAFLAAAPTLAQRIVRAKAKIREARIRYRVPLRDELPERLDAGLPGQQAWWTVKRQAMTADPRDPLGLYFGTTSGTLWASTDEGRRWTCIAQHLPEIYAVEAAEIA